jgi:hypothetical protein
MNAMDRWNDDRLDDLHDQVRAAHQRIEAMENIRGELIELRTHMSVIGEDSHECLRDLRQLKADLDKRAQDQVKERKADRRWVIATALTTAGLIIAALAIFLG